MARNLSTAMHDAQLLTTPGTLLAGKYRVERVLGTGGMGVVVAAIHEQLEERVAIKLLRADRLGHADAVERALREARATVKIQSDHVVRVFDVGTLEGGSPYIVMEYLAGCDLAQLSCAEGQLDIADAVSYARQACDAIAKAHAIGIIHRDLKPANLFLAVRDDVATIKVLDFGISKFVATDSGRLEAALTNTAAVLGSPAYMSPEQLETPRDVDGRTDVWSLGVILFELLTGAHPFVAETLPQLYRRIAEQPAPSLRATRPDVPPTLDAIVARCLEKKPQDRFPDLTTLASALAPFADSADVQALRVLPALAATAAHDAKVVDSARLRSKVSGPDPVIAMGIVTSTRRRRFTFAGVGLSFAAAIAMSAFVCVREDHPPRPAPAAAEASPLANPTSVLACPPLQASGVEQPSGWLGAAAATIVCTRAQARMGAHSARTLLPAELLGLPTTPIDNFPEDAFSEPTSRDKAIAAAKAKGAAWIDGEIVRDRDQFRVTLIARSGDRELARGTSRERTLIGAIRNAMLPLDNSVIPSVAAEDPFVREWLGATTADGAVAMTDWTLQMRLEWPDPTECEHVLARADVLPAAKAAVKNWCVPASQNTKVTERDTSSPGALVMSIHADGKLREQPLEPELANLDAALAKTTDHDARALVLAAKAEVLNVHNEFDRATQVALAAVNESPKALGGWSNAWDVLSWIRANSNAAPASNAWAPWHTEAYCFAATRNPDPELKVRYMRRNSVISHRPIWRQSLVEFLVQAGKRDEARTISAALPANDPVEILVFASEGRFANALDLARKLAAATDPHKGYTSAYVQMLGAQVDLVLGRPATGIDAFVKRVLEPEDSAMESDVVGGMMVAFACAIAPRDVAKRCFARLAVLDHGVIGFTPGMLEGAERFSQGDFVGATRAWKPLLAFPGWQLTLMHDLLAIAFEKSGAIDLAERVDAPYLAQPGRFNGADLVHVREARRAEQRGDVEAARNLANRVIGAWSTVDVDVPAVVEMRKLVGRLPASRDRVLGDSPR